MGKLGHVTYMRLTVPVIDRVSWCQKGSWFGGIAEGLLDQVQVLGGYWLKTRYTIASVGNKSNGISQLFLLYEVIKFGYSLSFV